MALDLTMPVLIVDDYATMVRIIRNLLKQLGFGDINDAANGDDAYKLMEDRQYGLVISDWNMVPMTGYELLTKVREHPRISQTPFIMITAEAKTERVIAAKRAGVNDYILKPFNAQTLRGKIEHVLGQDFSMKPTIRTEGFAQR
ncbi:response regulator [Pararhizobium sp. IMCC21322]|uniref:response regulator n=1 Tax=Pararhizobium sp. IMCC21322 TaxID=3067903 RepID=UPI0027412587|nr:response regulator [Pararhizobium sp. IMCC21322]